MCLRARKGRMRDLQLLLKVAKRTIKMMVSKMTAAKTETRIIHQVLHEVLEMETRAASDVVVEEVDFEMSTLSHFFFGRSVFKTS